MFKKFLCKIGFHDPVSQPIKDYEVYGYREIVCSRCGHVENWWAGK